MLVDLACYWMDASGRVVDLSALCRSGNAASSPTFSPQSAPVPRAVTPAVVRLEFSEMRYRMDSRNPYIWNVTGKVRNVGTEPIRVNLVEYQIVGRDGTIVDTGVIESYATIQPGQSALLSGRLPREVSRLARYAGATIKTEGFTTLGGYSRDLEQI